MQIRFSRKTKRQLQTAKKFFYQVIAFVMALIIIAHYSPVLFVIVLVISAFVFGQAIGRYRTKSRSRRTRKSPARTGTAKKVP